MILRKKYLKLIYQNKKYQYLKLAYYKRHPLSNQKRELKYLKQRVYSDIEFCKLLKNFIPPELFYKTDRQPF